MICCHLKYKHAYVLQRGQLITFIYLMSDCGSSKFPENKEQITNESY